MEEIDLKQELEFDSAYHPLLSKASKTYHNAKYILELHLGTFEVETFKIWNVRNIVLENKFKKFADPQKSTKDLQIDNSVNKVLEKGFSIKKSKGLRFPCGYIPSKMKGGQLYKALICEVAVKKTIRLEKSEVTPERLAKVGEENLFDSVLVTPDSKSGGKGETVHPFSGDLLLFDGCQVNPLFVAEVAYRKISKGICQVCEKYKAEVYCYNDDLDFCIKCDADNHNYSKEVSQKHKRVSIQEKPMVLEICEDHNLKREIFCKDCKTQICPKCKVSGRHSDPSLTGHTLMSVKECYQFLEKSKKKKSVQTTELSKKIKKCLKKLDSKVGQIREDFRILEENLKKRFEEITKKFHDLRNKKLTDLESIKILMENRFNELKWMEYFIKFQFDYLNPGEYLEKFFTHQRMQQSLYSNMRFPDEELMKIHGEYGIEITSEIIDLKVKRENERKERIRREQEAAKKAIAERAMRVKLKQQKILEERKREMEEKQRLVRMRLERERLEQERLRILEEKRREEEKYEYDPGVIINLSKESSNIVRALELQLPKDRIFSYFEEVFEESEILKNTSKAHLYFNCMNFKKRNPNPKAMPAIEFVEKFTSKNLPTPSQLSEIFIEIPYPTIFIFKYKEEIFGGYTDSSWNFTGKNGNDSCFLFSVTKDRVLKKNERESKHIYMWKEIDGMGWGATDLILNEDGSWMSMVEGTYTCNEVLREEERKVFLTGVHQFRPDLLEIFMVDYSDIIFGDDF